MEAPTIAEIESTKFIDNQLSLPDLECNEKWDDEKCENSGQDCNDLTNQYACFELTCNADGRPYPEYLWYHNDRQISEENGKVVLSKNNKTLTFIVKGSTKPSNTLAGTYFCRAKNLAGKAQSKKLIVKGPEILETTNNLANTPNDLEDGTEPPTILPFVKSDVLPFENHQILLEDIKCVADDSES